MRSNDPAGNDATPGEWDDGRVDYNLGTPPPGADKRGRGLSGGWIEAARPGPLCRDPLAPQYLVWPGRSPNWPEARPRFLDADGPDSFEDRRGAKADAARERGRGPHGDCGPPLSYTVARPSPGASGALAFAEG